jgi:hypothetical protein
MTQNETLKVFLFMGLMLLFTVLPGAILLGGVVTIRAWMSRKNRARKPDVRDELEPKEKESDPQD